MRNDFDITCSLSSMRMTIAAAANTSLGGSSSKASTRRKSLTDIISVFSTSLELYGLRLENSKFDK